MERAIKLVHFQLTKQCNLRCWFCGQWGKKGFFSDSVGRAMEFSDWENVIHQLCEYRTETGVSPQIILWGGEPLVYPWFEEMVRLLRDRGFELGIVTNGVMMEPYLTLLKEEFCHIYVSVDGPKEIHDQIRGEGVFDQVRDNLQRLRGTRATVSIMSVLSEEAICNLEQTVEALLELPCDQLLLQDMIGLSQAETAQYKEALKKRNMEAKYIDAWMTETLPRVNRTMAENLCRRYEGKVQYLPHGTGAPCRSPEEHIHIAWNGDLLYCTDFYDFSVGNVKNETLMNLFYNQASNDFRDMIAKGECPTCQHCSWRCTERFGL